MNEQQYNVQMKKIYEFKKSELEGWESQFKDHIMQLGAITGKEPIMKMYMMGHKDIAKEFYMKVRAKDDPLSLVSDFRKAMKPIEEKFGVKPEHDPGRFESYEEQTRYLIELLKRL